VEARGRPHSFALQALAIHEQKVYILAPPARPSTETRIFVDMEGSPDGPYVYLIGLLVQQGDKEQSYSFWADCREEETKVFELFVEILSQLPNGHVFYYGPYEARVFKRIARHFCPVLAGRLDRQCTNVLSTLCAKVYFPTYSNSLKDVATTLGYIWQVPMPSGLQTVIWRHQWEVAHNPALKAALLAYNRDDCQALKLVTRTTGFLFETRNGTRLTLTNVLRRHLHPALKELGYVNAHTGDHKAGTHAFRRYRNTYLRNETSCPKGLRDYWLGHAGNTMDDLYDMVKDNAALRKQKAAEYGVGFELPASNCTGQLSRMYRKSA